MTYNFTDDPTPDLTTHLDAAGDVQLTAGSPQGDFITNEFSGSTVVVTIVPPSGWNLTSVEWSSGNGTFTVPSPGVVETYSFDFTVSYGALQKSNSGVFKIKKTGD